MILLERPDERPDPNLIDSRRECHAPARAAGGADEAETREILNDLVQVILRQTEARGEDGHGHWLAGLCLRERHQHPQRVIGGGQKPH